MKIAWSLLARDIAPSVHDAGLDIRGLIVDGMKSRVGFPFRPKSLSIAVRIDTEIGEDAKGSHALVLIVSGPDGDIIAQLAHAFDLLAQHRTHLVAVPLKGGDGLAFPRPGDYQFNFILDNGVGTKDFVIRVR